MKPSNQLEFWRNMAQYFTMTMAILLFIVWALSGFNQATTGWKSTTSTILIWATCIGGVVMGILWVTYLVTHKK